LYNSSVYCRVTNTINYTDLNFQNESITYFYIQTNLTLNAISSNNLKDWEITLIVLFLMVILVITATFIIKYIHSRLHIKNSNLEILNNQYYD
jgi:hypothetical protein